MTRPASRSSSLTYVLLLLSACAHGEGTPITGELSAVPDACRVDLTGSWEHEGNMSFRYEAVDDGKALKLAPHRVNADGSPLADDAKLTETKIDLARRADGFTGDFQLVQTTSTGQRCPLQFAARITACAPDRLVLQVEQSYAVNESCQRIDMGGADIAEHVLIRRRLDAGVPAK